MRRLRCKQKLSGLILTALTAGALGVPAVAAQDGSTAAKKPPAHKHSTAHAAPSHTSTTHTSAAHSSTATHSGATHTTSTIHSNAAHAKTASTTSSHRTSKKRVRKVKGQAAPTPERITEIQEALAKKGMLEGSPSGQWDDATSDAMKKFQSSNGLNPTGKLDALTLQKLGLGSETAGLAAPTPPPNASNRLKYLSSLPPESNSSNQ
jgi:murein L,D-transpeptidase YcbB/YkuD